MALTAGTCAYRKPHTHVRVADRAGLGRRTMASVSIGLRVVLDVQMPIQALIPVAEGEESEYNVLRAWRTPQAATLSLMARAAGLPDEAG